MRLILARNKMAARDGAQSGFGLRFHAELEQGLHRRIKIEEEDLSDSVSGYGSGETPLIGPSGRILEFLHKPLGEQEAGDGLLQLWEVQMQEFLKTLEQPQAEWETSQLLEEPTPWDNTKTFLASFEQVAEACKWPREDWMARLLPALGGEAEQIFSSLDIRDRVDYDKDLAPMEEVALDFPEEGEPPSHCERRQDFRPATQKADDGDSSSVGDCYLSTDDDEAYPLESPSQGHRNQAAQGRRTEREASHFQDQEAGSEGWCQAEQKSENDLLEKAETSVLWEGDEPLEVVEGQKKISTRKESHKVDDLHFNQNPDLIQQDRSSPEEKPLKCSNGGSNFKMTSRVWCSGIQPPLP
uniref:Uncharacterized protein n=1 Tax=Sphaerodactylus townsendi TaxID=933632 RepID=A0ACB8EFI9_9SAUR